MYFVRFLGSRTTASSAGVALSSPAKPPNIEGTTRLATCCRSAAVAGGGVTPGGGGGGKRRSTRAGGGPDPTARSGVETLTFVWSAGALLHPKIVQPPFSA